MAEAVDQHRALELARLDALQASLWDRAEAGDVKAVNAVLRIIDQRSRLLGLDKPGDTNPGSGSLVDPAYWEQLKETHGRTSS